MTDVLLDRHFDEPLTQADIQGMFEVAQNCLGIHRVTWCQSLLSSDAKHMVCHFRGPDAESVRIAVHDPSRPRGTVFACKVQDAPDLADGDLARANVLVDHRFEEPVDFGARQVTEIVDTGCFQIHRVRMVRSYLSSDRRRLLAMYQAPDAESVRLAHREAGYPVHRISAVRRHSP